MKRFLSTPLVLCLMLSLMPAAAFAADSGFSPGTYYNTVWDEATKTVVGSTEAVPAEAKVFSGAFEYESGENTSETVWYVVESSMTVNNQLEVLRHKTVNLVLRDGVTLTCNKGIRVARRDGTEEETYVGTLNIYGESATGGTLIVYAEEDNAAIGGNDNYFSGIINIHSGTVKANGGKWAAGIGSGAKSTAGWWGVTSVYGGYVEAKGGVSGAGIGRGTHSHGGTIRIYGGTIDAYGGDSSAGIGAGNMNGKFEIEVYGGTVNATAGWSGAGIGGGIEANATGSFKMYGGDVTARGLDVVNIVVIENYAGAGLGAGASERGRGGDFAGTIEIRGGNLRAIGGGAKVPGDEADKIYHQHLSGYQEFGAAGIGVGYGGNMTGTITISGGTVYAKGNAGGAGIGAGAEAPAYPGFNAGGECEGTVNITGRDVTAKTGSIYNRFGQAIGYQYYAAVRAYNS